MLFREKIEARLLAAAQADFVVCLYNPSSKKRHDYLQKACDLMMKYKSPDTICGTVSNIAREGEEAHVMTLKELRDTQVDMFTTVFIGNAHCTNPLQFPCKSHLTQFTKCFYAETDDYRLFL